MQLTITMPVTEESLKWSGDLARIKHYLCAFIDELPAARSAMEASDSSELTLDFEGLDGRGELTLSRTADDED